MKKLTFPTQEEAQVIADACHDYLIANDISYAGSVASDRTLRWAIPEQDGADWFIWVTPQLAPVDPAIAALFPSEAV